MNQALKNAQSLLYQGKTADALAQTELALSQKPDDIEALYTKAVCQRYMKDAKAALKTLQQLKAIAPELGRSYQEEGHLLREHADAQGAMAAYAQAVALNPGLEASWRALAALQRNSGDTKAAQLSIAQANRLKSLPKELFAVTNFLHEGKLLKAENLCRAFLKVNKTHIEGMRLLADIGMRLGVMEEADYLLETALEFEPDNIQVRLDYIQILSKRQKFDAAMKQAEYLYEKDPSNPVFQSRYAIESLQVNEYDRALELFDKVLATLPDDPATLTSRGHALKTVGRQDEAIQSYRKAYTAGPHHGDAYYALANLKTYRFTDDELQRMQSQEDDIRTSHASRIHLCFALGKAYEDRSDFARSFAFYQRGNDLKRTQSRYDADQMHEELAAQADVCTKELFAKHAGHGHPDAAPIFIVGLPRAGSTLLEQVLASHSMVDGTLELPNVLALSHRLRNRQKVSADTSYPRVLHSLSAEQLHALGADYIKDTRVHRKDAPYFTDKMPNNFRHIGLIKLMLPNAKIIDARREPMACCFSGFKQLFAEGQEFTYGLEQIGRYYKDYVQLMEHWDSVLPGEILRVHYEDVVADLETQVRRILDFCELPFEEGCVAFHQTKRAVRTASSEQVRQPIFSSGLDYWKNYAPSLAPLEEALGEVMTSYRKD